MTESHFLVLAKLFTLLVALALVKFIKSLNIVYFEGNFPKSEIPKIKINSNNLVNSIFSTVIWMFQIILAILSALCDNFFLSKICDSFKLLGLMYLFPNHTQSIKSAEQKLSKSLTKKKRPTHSHKRKRH